MNTNPTTVLLSDLLAVRPGLSTWLVREIPFWCLAAPDFISSCLYLSFSTRFFFFTPLDSNDIFREKNKEFAIVSQQRANWYLIEN